MTAALALLAARGPTPIADLPFERRPGRILLRTTLNGHSATTTLDSGASETAADAEAAHAAGATRGKAVTVSGNGASGVAGWRAEGLSLRLEGSDVSVPVRLAVPLGGLDAGGARPLDAILGCDLLNRYVAEIDYVRGRLRLFEPGGYRVPKGYATSPLRLVNGRPVVEGSIQAAGVRMDRIGMLVDTGSASGVDLGEALVRRSGLADRVVGDATEGIAGLGGAARTRPLLGATGRVGRTAFSGGVRMSLTSGGAGEDADARIGDEFLGHFDVVLDLPHAILSLRPNGR